MPRKNKGRYNLESAETKDPFKRGIYFHCEFVSSVEVKHKHDNPEVQKTVNESWEKETADDRKLRKMYIVVYAESIVIKDRETGDLCDHIPIHRISYAGTSMQQPHLFYFIHLQTHPTPVSYTHLTLPTNREV